MLTLTTHNAQEYGLLQLTQNMNGEQVGLFTLHGKSNGPDSVPVMIDRNGIVNFHEYRRSTGCFITYPLTINGADTHHTQ